MSKHRADTEVVFDEMPETRETDPERIIAAQFIERCRTLFTDDVMPEVLDLISARAALDEAIASLLDLDTLMAKLRLEQKAHLDRFLNSSGVRGRGAKARAEAYNEAYAMILFRIEEVISPGKAAGEHPTAP